MNLTEIQLYDTLSGKKKAFEARSAKAVNVYCCGPTVYGYTHVGNARAALSLDLLVRCFEYFGYKVFAARNYTDIDDKIIKVAQKEGRSFSEVASFYEKAYREEMAALKIREPDFSPRATEHIPQMIQIIAGLIQKSKAYELKTEFGVDVYYRVQAFNAYGKLSKRDIDSIVQGTRAETEEGKQHPADFALWKASKPGEPFWESPWGRGRPGWHIECSAMIHGLFGTDLDIHMGGLDLIFPHHENEIAQSEAYTGSELARYWVHNGMIEVDKEKMSKSLGNIISTRKFLENYGPECLRVLIYSHHYRSPIDFSAQLIHAAETTMLRLYQALEVASQYKNEPEAPELSSLLPQIEKALRDDLNSAKALGLLLGAARTCFKKEDPACWSSWYKAQACLQQCLGILNSNLKQVNQEVRERRIKRSGLSSDRVQQIEELLNQRQQLRAEKKFKEADLIRDQLEKENILVMDSPEGSSWSVKEEVHS